MPTFQTGAVRPSHAPSPYNAQHYHVANLWLQGSAVPSGLVLSHDDGQEVQTHYRVLTMRADMLPSTASPFDTTPSVWFSSMKLRSNPRPPPGLTTANWNPHQVGRQSWTNLSGMTTMGLTRDAWPEIGCPEMSYNVGCSSHRLGHKFERAKTVHPFSLPLLPSSPQLIPSSSCLNPGSLDALLADHDSNCCLASHPLTSSPMSSCSLAASSFITVMGLADRPQVHSPPLTQQCTHAVLAFHLVSCLLHL